jgi:hypothetical protein
MRWRYSGLPYRESASTSLLSATENAVKAYDGFRAVGGCLCVKTATTSDNHTIYSGQAAGAFMSAAGPQERTDPAGHPYPLSRQCYQTLPEAP